MGRWTRSTRIALGIGALVTGVVVVAPASAADRLVMPYTCEVRGGRVHLTPAPDTTYVIAGLHEQQAVTACSPVLPHLCRTWMAHKLDLSCGGTKVSWLSVTGAMIGRRPWRGWIADGRLHLRMGARWTGATAADCGWRQDPDDAPSDMRRRPLAAHCSSRFARQSTDSVPMPRGYAPALAPGVRFVMWPSSATGTPSMLSAAEQGPPAVDTPTSPTATARGNSPGVTSPPRSPATAIVVPIPREVTALTAGQTAGGESTQARPAVGVAPLKAEAIAASRAPLSEFAPEESIPALPRPLKDPARGTTEWETTISQTPTTASAAGPSGLQRSAVEHRVLADGQRADSPPHGAVLGVIPAMAKPGFGHSFFWATLCVVLAGAGLLVVVRLRRRRASERLQTVNQPPSGDAGSAVVASKAATDRTEAEPPHDPVVARFKASHVSDLSVPIGEGAMRPTAERAPAIETSPVNETSTPMPAENDPLGVLEVPLAMQPSDMEQTLTAEVAAAVVEQGSPKGAREADPITAVDSVAACEADPASGWAAWPEVEVAVDHAVSRHDEPAAVVAAMIQSADTLHASVRTQVLWLARPQIKAPLLEALTLVERRLMSPQLSDQVAARAWGPAQAIIADVLRDLGKLQAMLDIAGRELPVRQEARPPRDPGAIPVDAEEAYSLLGVNPDADERIVKKVVDGLRQSWHPDLARDEQDRQHREQRTKGINVAWELIRGHRRRAAA